MTIKASFKERDIIIEFFGLKPLTTHYFYYEKNKVTDKVKQFGKKLGDPLITDSDGKLKVVFYLSSGISSNSAENLPRILEKMSVGKREIVLTNLNQDPLPNSYYSTSKSFTAFILGSDKII